MSALNRRHFLLFGTTALALVACGKAADTAPSKITVTNAWMRVPPGGRDTSAAYLVIRNDGGADTLLSVSSPMADDVQMHISEMSDNVMRMRHEETVPIPANSTINYQPGGRHFMVFGLREGIKAGDEVPLTLTFERAGEITVTAIMGTNRSNNIR